MQSAGGQPGGITGPCIQGQCLPGLICLPSNECYPSANTGSGNDSNGTDPTETGGTGGTSDSSTSGPVTSGPTTNPDPPDVTTTGVDTTSTTSVTSASTTSNTSVSTGDPPEMSTSSPNTSDDSNGFVDPPDTTGGGDEMCGFDVCLPDQVCVPVDQNPTCLQQCDPLSPGACWVDEVCVPFDQGAFFVCAPDASGNLGKIGDGCQYANGCDLGNTCITGQYVSGCNAPYCCTAFCDLDLPDLCPQYGMQCESYYQPGMAPSGHEDVGVCLL